MDSKSQSGSPIEPVAAAVGNIMTFPAGTPDATLRAAFACALDLADDNEAFRCYAALNVLRNRNSSISLEQLRAYNWRHFRFYAHGYAVATEPFTLNITQRDPKFPSANTRTIKVFLRSTGDRPPAPMTLDLEDGQWRIAYNSL